ncbi:MAG: DNA-processing protein DprA [Acidobacteria bacterium]|nr:DNA-processing protein DprA [Acidobacteriota bacterium]
MKLTHLTSKDPEYPAILTNVMGAKAPQVLSMIGDISILKRPTVALFCSVKCPGELILKTYDLAQQWRAEETTIISGFHSPIEQECLVTLLRGKQSIIICPARGLEGMRLKDEWKKPLVDERLLLLSIFGQPCKQPSVRTATLRNQFVATLADQVFVSYAAEGGKTEQFCKTLIEQGKSVLTFESKATENLVTLGAEVFKIKTESTKSAEG